VGIISFSRGLLNIFVLVCNYFNQFALFYDRNSLSFKPFLSLFFKIKVIKSVLVYDRHILSDLRVSLLIHVTLLSWNCQNNVLVLDASVNETLNSCVNVKSSTINYTFSLATAISQLLHQ
jgi:hypothetical protein